MDTKKIILLGGLGVIAVVAFLQLQRMSEPPAPVATAAPIAQVIANVEYVEILATTRDIGQGTRLTSDMLQWKKWPAEALEANLVDIQNQPQALEEYTGAVTLAKIYEGEPLMRPKVVQAGDRGLMAAQLKPGMRAISTRITADTAAGGFIQPGDRVDVVLTTQLLQRRQAATTGGQNNFVSNTIFENVPVLAIGQTSTQNPDGTAYVIGSTALLEMSRSDAENLTEAQSRGDISLILRGLNRRSANFVASRATSERKKSSTALGSLTIYRNGQKQQVAIQGR
ncbi:MAG: Flp pilus assembly protein CpaB [Robiginitomaculum sp.]|nr:Flp pilus assembly protein CpaB [Robiginitomaculum sp.]